MKWISRKKNGLFHFQINILIGILMFCGFVLKSQNHQFTFHELSEKDGLTQSNQYHISSDKRGFKWIGTDNGLLRFDGLSFKKYQHDPSNSTSIFENRITSKCIEDFRGNLWFTSIGALNCYNTQTNSFVHFKVEGEVKDYFLFDIEGEILSLRIGAREEGFLYSFDLEKKIFFKSINLPGTYCIPIKNKKGNIGKLLSVALPDDPGLIYIDLENKDSTYVQFKESSKGVKKNFSSPTTKGLVDDKKNAWIGLYNSIGKYILGDNSGLVIEDRVNGIDTDFGWVYDIIHFKYNQLLIATDKGLLIFDKSQEKFVKQFRKRIGDNYPLNLKGINALHIDKANNLWLSGKDQKIAFANIDKNRFSHLAETSGLSFVNITEAPDGNIWCSALDSGTYVFTPEKELLFHTNRLNNPRFDNGFNPLPEIYFFLNNAQNQWWGNIGNYFFLWDESLNEFKIDFSYFLGVANTSYDRINFCYSLSNGKKLVARGNQILEVKLKESKVDTVQWFPLESFNLNIITNVYEDKSGNIFINDDYGKLLIVQVKNNYLTLLSNESNFGVVHAFQEDKSRNKIWVVGTKGLGVFDSKTLDFELYKGNKSILKDVILNDIILDKTGQLWFPSSNGILRLNPDSGKAHCFNTADGLLSNVFSKNSSFISSKTGEIWAGSKNGINVFNPSEIKSLSTKPKPQIIDLYVNDEAFELEENIIELEKLKLPYDQNTLSFQFTSLDFADPVSNEYLHQMVGLDETPVTNSTRGFTRYANIPAGKYTFKVWATNSDLILNENPLEWTIEITPPFYQTWWFYLLCFVAMSGIIYGVFKYRIAQILKVERLRTRIASDLHDDVGGILSGLAMQSELLELTALDEDKSKLRQLADMSRNAMSGMRDTVWAIDARKEKFEDLLDRIREHAEEVLTPKDIHYDIDIHAIPLKLTLPPLIRQNLYLIFKEAITNIAKHSNGDLVQIDLKRGKSYFEMRIHDNGTVANKPYKTTGLGMSNMKLRAKNLGGELFIDTESGYEIILKISSF